MGRRSPKLKDKGEAVVALLKYIKQQSNKTLLELEQQFTPRGGEDDHGGRQWSRWINRNAQPEIGIITILYNFACAQLVNGEWEENGNESQWSQLLSAVIDPRLSFLLDAEKISTLLEILKHLKNPFVTERWLRGIAAGYYIPSVDDMQKIFWHRPSHKGNAANEYVPWHRIWPQDDVIKTQMEDLMTDIFMNLGLPAKNRTVLEEFAHAWGFACGDLETLADQLHHQIQQDAQTLHEIQQRMNRIYPLKFKWTDNLDDESEKDALQNHVKLQECLALANNKFEIYSEFINSTSKASRMFGLLNRLTALYSGTRSVEWNYPAIEIM
jgi:hypothetical protein